jgi:hypothetical protein
MGVGGQLHTPAAKEEAKFYIWGTNKTFLQLFSLSVISGFRRDVDGIWALLGYYAASSGNVLPTFRYNVLTPK